MSVIVGFILTGLLCLPWSDVMVICIIIFVLSSLGNLLIVSVMINAVLEYLVNGETFSVVLRRSPHSGVPGEGQPCEAKVERTERA